MKFGIDRYIGNWINEKGYRLEIKKVDNSNALVSMFSPLGQPISRVFWQNKKTTDMPAQYDDYMGEFDVQLWELEKDFCLNLHYDNSNFDDESEEMLVPSLTRYEKDNFLDSHYDLFGGLSTYKKEKEQTTKY